MRGDIPVFSPIFKSYYKKYNLPNQVSRKLSGNQTESLKDHYLTLWKSKIQHSNKLEFYSSIKTTYEHEDYLKSVQNISFRKELSSLASSSSSFSSFPSFKRKLTEFLMTR